MRSICNSKHGILLSNARLLVASPLIPRRTAQRNEVIFVQERNAAVLIRLSEKEKKHLKNQSAACGMKMEPYIRKLIMGTQIRPRPPDEYVRLAREVNAIGNNINQIAHIANSEQHITPDKISEVLQMQNELIRLMRSMR